MFNITRDKASEQQSRDLKLVELAVNLDNLIKSQEKVDQDIKGMANNFAEFSRKLDGIANELSQETTSLKRDLKDFDSQKEKIEKIENIIEEFKPSWKKYKMEREKDEETFLGIKRGVLNYIAIAIVVFIFIEVVDYVRNPPSASSVIEKIN